MWYFHKGTRSEGIHGILVIDKFEVAGTNVGQTMATDISAFTWYGPWNSRKLPFSKTGWLPDDLSKVYPSWKTNNAEQATPAGHPEAGRP